MFTLETGLYPFTAIWVGALLTLIFFGVVRMKCAAHWAIGFIFAAMAVITVCSMVTPVQRVDFSTVAKEQELLNLNPIPNTKDMGSYSSENETIMPISLSGLETRLKPESHEVNPIVLIGSLLFGWLWVTGIVVMLLSLMWQMVCLYRLRQNQDYLHHANGTNFFAVDGTQAFSFGHNVFIPRMFDDEMRKFMTLHEQAHVKRHHFLWLCLCWVLLALNWYNPFCWLLFREMHLQQELQVDADVIHQKVDRTAYQYALLRATMQGGSPVWILSAFGRKPVTQRIAFMNRNINARSSVRRVFISLLLAFVVLSLAAATVYTNNVKLKEHPLMGWWKMDFTKATDSDTEQYPLGKQIAFFNYDTFLTMKFRMRNSKSLYFTFSTEETRLQNDTLVNALGDPIDYDFIDDDTFQNHWVRLPYQKAMPKSKDITDQWSRIDVDGELLRMFEKLSRADAAHGRRLDGVWKRVGFHEQYFIIKDTIALLLNYHNLEPKAYRAEGHGHCGTLKKQGHYLQLGTGGRMKFTISDTNVLMLDDGEIRYTYQRINMPADLKRMLRTPLTHAYSYGIEARQRNID